MDVRQCLRQLFFVVPFFVVACGGGSGGSGKSTPKLTAGTVSVQVAEDAVLSGSTVLAGTQGVTYALAQSPTSGSINITLTGAYTYTPNADFNGADSFSYNVYRGNESARQQVQIEVTPVNDLPVASASSASGYRGYPLAAQLAASDIDNEALLFEIVSDVTNGSLTLGDDGSFSYLSAADFLGADSFSFRVFDGVGYSAEAIVQIQVSVPAPKITLTPATIADVALEQRQRELQSLTIGNAGVLPLTYQLRISEELEVAPVAARTPVAPLIYQDIKKGQQDLRVGNVGIQGSGGRDNFGYFWADSNELGGPEFNWIDISVVGTQLLGLSDDNVVGPVPIGFDFNYYGQIYSEVFVGSNGLVYFNESSGNHGCCSGQPIPLNDSVNNVIAWLWRDLHPRNGQVYYHTLDDDSFVLQFVNYGEFASDGVINAQVILHRNGDIVLQYLSLENRVQDRSYSIGIENQDGSDGLQIAFNTPYLENNLAIRIGRSAAWVNASQQGGTIAPGESVLVELSFLGNSALGGHQAELELTHNDPNQSDFVFPLALTIAEDITPPFSAEDLSVTALSFDRLTLNWLAPSDQSYRAVAVESYEIRRSSDPITEANWHLATPLLDVPVPVSPGAVQQLNVPALSPETSYYFALRASDDKGNVSALSNVVVATTPQAPIASISGLAINAELSEGYQTTGSLVLSNSGESDLQYSLRLEELEAAVVALGGKVKATATASANERTLYKINALPKQGTFAPSELIVRYKPKRDKQNAHNLLQQYNANLVQRFDALQMEVWRFADDSVLLQVIQQLNGNNDVLFAEPNYRLKSHAIPNDARFNELWGLHNTGVFGGVVDADIDAVEAWDLTKGSRNVVVAVIDTGIDFTHSELAVNIWTNAGEIPDNGIDDDGNGFVDDVHGYDFANNDGNPFDDNSHGTHVAGTIGAAGENGYGVVGVNHQVSLMGVKFLGAFGSGTTDGAIAAILYAVDNGATILNNSWGGGRYSEALRAAIEYANDHEVLFVAAAGNSGTDNDIYASYPANYEVDNVLSVAATDRNDQLAAFSQYGLATVDLGAPGVDILSTLPSEEFESFNGTSMATPHVAGAAALLKAYRPSLSSAELKQLLLDSVDPIASLADKTVTGGRLNVHSALRMSGPRWVQFAGNISGAVALGESVELVLVFDATDIEPGEYIVHLKIQTNDPLNPEITVPVTLVVTPDVISPTGISDLSVSDISDTNATLSFTATGDDGVVGRATAYDIRFSSSELTQANWELAAQVTGVVLPAPAGASERIIVRGLTPNTPLWIGVRARDNVGLMSDISNVVQVTTLNADLLVSPATLPTITLSKGQQTDVVLSLENIGAVDLDVNVFVGEEAPSPSAVATQYFSNKVIAKGEVDQRVGSPVLQGSGGPDQFGYVWRDSDEVGGPVFNWNDISSTGTLVTGFYDDNVIGPINIGFGFPFYGVNQNQVYISSNGFISFSPSSSGCCAGSPLPSADGINHLIAWLWYDLHPRYGTVHYQQVDASTLIIQFTDYGEFGGFGSVDAQIILRAGGIIELQYKALKNGLSHTRASIGIENEDGSDGLQIAFNTDYLRDEKAIRISAFWLSADLTRVELMPTESADVTLTVDAGALDVGSYSSEVIIRSNDSAEPEVRMPVLLEVVE